MPLSIQIKEVWSSGGPSLAKTLTTQIKKAEKYFRLQETKNTILVEPLVSSTERHLFLKKKSNEKIMIIRDKMPLIMSLYKRGILINKACQVKYKTRENTGKQINLWKVQAEIRRDYI
jgi:hypothetical protein